MMIDSLDKVKISLNQYYSHHRRLASFGKENKIRKEIRFNFYLNYTTNINRDLYMCTNGILDFVNKLEVEMFIDLWFSRFRQSKKYIF